MSEKTGNIFADNLGIIITFLAFLITTAGFCWLMWDKMATQGERIARLEERMSICVKCDGNNYPIEKNKDGYKWTEYKSEDRDNKGNVSFAVEVDVLEDRYRWACGKSEKEDIKKNRWLIDGNESLEEIIKKYDPKVELVGAKKIIVVGTASSEGDLPSQNDLAEKRARTLLGIVNKNLNSFIPVIGMSFGQYVADSTKAKCSDDTSEQRRILIVKVNYPQTEMSDSELEQRLINRFEELAKSGSFPIDIDNYSNKRNNKTMFLK